MKAFVTGGAGFIGSNLVRRLLLAGHAVTVYDNLSTGFKRNLEPLSTGAAFHFVQGDLLDLPALTEAMRGCDTVFHLAANADVRFGTQNPRRDLDQNTIGTFHVLEAIRQSGVERIAFSSTSAIYGEAKVIPTPEDAPFPVQTSLYAASKLAGEGMIQAYAEGFGIKTYIFRYVSILGEHYSHGHIFDFYKMLRKDSHRLHVLGDGTQRKSYLYVQECIDGMLLALEKAHAKVNIFNLGTEEHSCVLDSIGWICEHLGLKPELDFGGGKRGWAGDNPFIFLDCTRMRALGWKPTVPIREGVIRTLDFIVKNDWLIEAR